MRFRQGDLCIVKIEELPKNLKKRKEGVILYGEATGHSHRLKDGEVYESGELIYLNVPYITEIIHEEHDPIPLEKGIYEIKRQREYQSKDMVRLVVD